MYKLFFQLMKVGFLFFIVVSFFSCSSSDDSISEEEENQPIETRKFVSKIYYDSSVYGSDVFSYNYNSNNNLISIGKNNELTSFFYSGNKINRIEITNNSSGELQSYANYFYNDEGLLDYYEGDFYLSRVVRYEYVNERVVKIFTYNSLEDLIVGNFTTYSDVLYTDTTKNVTEYNRYNVNGELTRKGTRSYGVENKRYFGEAASLINLPSSDDIFESFNYYTNYNLKAWKTSFNSSELELYRESFFENDQEGYCLEWYMVFYNTETQGITSSITKIYEYIDLEVN